MRLHIKGGCLIDPVNGTDVQQDSYIAASKVVGVGHTPTDFHANKTIDATGLVVCLGLVDLSAHLREPGFEYRATLESEMVVVMTGGVTSLACPPDIDSVLDESNLVEVLKFRARNLNRAHVYLLGTLTVGSKGAVLTEMAGLTESGCVGFSQTDVPMIGTQVLMHALQYAQTLGFTVWLRPEDPYLGKGGVTASGPPASCPGFSGVPVIAETVCLHTIFKLIRSTGARTHLCHLSSAASIELVCRAKAEGLLVMCDVDVHHISLTDVDIGYFNSQMRFVPPLRSRRDRDGIVRALADGTINAICSNHTPVDDDEKLLSSAEATLGAIGLKTLLPLTLRWATEHKVEFSKALARITSESARVLSLRAGSLEVGVMVDVCVFGSEATWKLGPRALRGQGKNSPYLGLELAGRVRATIVTSHPAYDGH